jgi:hypothetical protein
MTVQSENLKIEVVDLSSSDNQHNEKTPRHCKFILVEREDLIGLVFGDITTYNYHANLVDEYCSTRGIAASWVAKPDLLLVLDPDVAIRGGGYLNLDQAARKAEFSGGSKSYGVFRLRELEKILQIHPFFENYQIHLDT